MTSGIGGARDAVAVAQPVRSADVATAASHDDATIANRPGLSRNGVAESGGTVGDHRPI